MKRMRSLVTLLTVLSLLSLAPAAFAVAFCTDTYGEGGVLCGSYCAFYDDNDNFTGSISVDYNC